MVGTLPILKMARLLPARAVQINMMALMRKYLLTGLLIWVPLVITVWVLTSVIGVLDQVLVLIPPQWQPKALIGFSIPGLGVVITALILLFSGMIAANVIGNRVLKLWDDILKRIPFFNTIYNSVKQVSDTLLASNGQAFRKALLIQYPHAGVRTIAFLTGAPGGELIQKLGEEEYVSVYVPTTPNPTSGFFLMIPKKDTIELDMSVDEALKYIISMGVVGPKS